MEKYPRLSLTNEDSVSKVSCLIQTSVADTYPLHCHDFYEIFYVVSGKAIHRINDTTQVISEGSLFFLRPNDLHTYSFLNHYDMELLSCGIQPELVGSTCRFLGLDCGFIYAPKLPPYLIVESSRRFDILEDLKQIARIPAGDKRTQYFLSIFPKLLYLFHNSQPVSPVILPLWLKNLLEEMERPENFVAGLEKMLVLSNVRQEHLNREFRRCLDITPTEYINMKRMNYAGKLLLERKHEILDICFLCGYNNLSYFYRIFQKQYHCTPWQFLKKYSSPTE